MKTFVDDFFKLDNFWSITGYILGIVFISWLFSRVARYFIVFIIKRKQKDQFGKTSFLFLRNSIKFFIGLFALMYIIFSIPIFRSKAAFIFSGAGILAAIIGFAAQAAISNLIAGVFIVMFKPFRVGDFIRLDESRVGIVDDITLRHTVINNFENKRLIIPNSIISTESVLNHTIEDFKVLTFNNFMIGIYADIDLARKIIQEEAQKLQYTIDNPESRISKYMNNVDVRVISTEENRIHLRAYIWMNDAFEEYRNRAFLTEAVHKRFVSEGVDLPITITKIIKDE